MRLEVIFGVLSALGVRVRTNLLHLLVLRLICGLVNRGRWFREIDASFTAHAL